MDTANALPGDAGHGGLRPYVIGLVLALGLTVIPFWMVMSAYGPRPAVIAAFGVAQIVVHLVFFLRVNHSSGERWNLLALLFTVLVLVIIVGGSMWIMHNLDHNMMPMPMAAGDP
jgi:cytochrome o ubiquinol oxidase operon protein cyoD